MHGPDWALDWVRFNVPPNTLSVILGTGFYGSNGPTNSVKLLKKEHWTDYLAISFSTLWTFELVTSCDRWLYAFILFPVGCLWLGGRWFLDLWVLIYCIYHYYYFIHHEGKQGIKHKKAHTQTYIHTQWVKNHCATIHSLTTPTDGGRFSKPTHRCSLEETRNRTRATPPTTRMTNNARAYTEDAY